jgi:hypothetical protein
MEFVFFVCVFVDEAQGKNYLTESLRLVTHYQCFVHVKLLANHLLYT